MKYSMRKQNWALVQKYAIIVYFYYLSVRITG